VNEWHDHRSFANGQSHAVHGAGANVASLEHAGRDGLEGDWFAALPQRACLFPEPAQPIDLTLEVVFRLRYYGVQLRHRLERSAAARLLDTERTALHKRIRTLGLKRQPTGALTFSSGGSMPPRLSG